MSRHVPHNPAALPWERIPVPLNGISRGSQSRLSITGEDKLSCPFQHSKPRSSKQNENLINFLSSLQELYRT